MKPYPLLSNAVLCLVVALVSACGTVKVSDDRGPQGGNGPGGSGGSGGGSECGDIPLDCIGGQFKTNENGCLYCDYDTPQPCNCGPNQECVVCNSAGPPFGSCENIEPVTQGSFQCKWLACAVGDVCLDVQPQGDGCPDAECDALPPECAADPTCDCIQAAYPSAFGCSEDADGNVTISKWPF